MSATVPARSTQAPIVTYYLRTFCSEPSRPEPEEVVDALAEQGIPARVPRRFHGGSDGSLGELTLALESGIVLAVSGSAREVF